MENPEKGALEKLVGRVADSIVDGATNAVKEAERIGTQQALRGLEDAIRGNSSNPDDTTALEKFFKENPAAAQKALEALNQQGSPALDMATLWRRENTLDVLQAQGLDDNAPVNPGYNLKAKTLGELIREVQPPETMPPTETQNNHTGHGLPPEVNKPSAPTMAPFRP